MGVALFPKMANPAAELTDDDFLGLQHRGKEMKVTSKEMADAKIPLHLRDYCAHLLIPMMKCQLDNSFLPWKCKHEEHLWQECQMEDYYLRTKLKERMKVKAAELKKENS